MKVNGQMESKVRLWIVLAVMVGMTQALMAQGSDEVYRIVIAKDVGDKEGRDNRLMLETLGYIPVHMTGDFTGGGGTVSLGNYPTQKEAQRIKEQLVRDGFAPLDIVKEKRTAAGGGNLTVLAGSFDAQKTATDQKAKLDAGGVLNVQIRKDDASGKFLVTVGNFTSPDQANSVVANLKDSLGFRDAKIVDANNLSKELVSVAPADAPSKVTAADIKKATGKDLSDADLNELATLLEKKLNLESQKSSAGTSGTVSDEIVKLNKRLQEMDEKLGGVVKDVAAMQDERMNDANKRKQISELFRDSNNLAKGGRNEEALVKIREILAMDPENQIAQQRAAVLQRILEGKDVDFEQDMTRKYEGMKQLAMAAEEAGTVPDLINAKSTWGQILVLNDNFKPEATAKMAALEEKIKDLTAKQDLERGGQAAGGNLIYGLIGAVFLLVIVVVFVLYRQNKQKQDILEKLQEATSLRPMRGLPGGGRRQADYGLMAPPGMSGQGGPADAGFQGFDPMGGMPPQGAPQPGFNAGFGAPTGSPVAHGGDDLFSSEPEPSKPAAAVMTPPPPPRPVPAPAPAATSSLDDILGSMSTPQAAPASGGLDDILSGMGGAPKAPAPAPEEPTFSPLDDIFNPKPVAAPIKKTAIEETSSVSLDDILGIGSSSAPAAPAGAPASSGPSLDDILGMGSAPKAAAPAVDLGLDALLGGSKSASSPGMDFPQMGSPTPLPKDSMPSFGGDDTIIDPNAAQFANVGGAIPGLGGVRSPASDETIGGLTPMPSGLNGEAFLMNFEGDSVGQKPATWSGDFAYATLNVQNDTPPDGSSNYLAYNKKEGLGKVYYSTKFPNTSGVVSVEFDLRCNDKNKFLLGFYIEKDEDFQQSIHTKILRSESQTAPSIHIHGQPAPYLLGTWAKIKYVIDLNEGKVDGFVDGRQVAKSITLPQVPKYLNTLAIRDNINTTGSLFIDNITVKKIS